MPFIIGFLRNLLPALFAGLASFISGFVARVAPGAAVAALKVTSNLGKIALVIAAIAAAVVVFSAAINLALGGLALMAPANLLEVGRMLMPSNIDTCIAVLMLARLKSLVFFWIVRISEKFERA